MVGVAAHELLDATCAVDDALLTGEERVGECGDFDGDDVVLDSVDHAGLITLECGHPGPLVLAIHKEDGKHLGMRIGLHSKKALYPQSAGPSRVGAAFGDEKRPSPFEVGWGPLWVGWDCVDQSRASGNHILGVEILTS